MLNVPETEACSIVKELTALVVVIDHDSFGKSVFTARVVHHHRKSP